MATTDPFHAATAISGGTGKLSTAQDDFLQQVDGDMTADQAAQFLELVMGDTGLPENSGLPEPTPEVATTTEEPGLIEAELTADNAQLMAKDGKHVIDFQKLVDAREGEKTWRATAELAQQELEALKAAAQQREDAGLAPTVVDNKLAAAEAAIDAGADASLFGDFSEEAMTAGLKALVAQQVNQQVAQQVSEQVAKALAPIQKQTEEEAYLARHAAHVKAIAEAHPDYESLVESKELSDWIDSQPGIARDGYRAALARGTTGQYIELFDTFKAATGKSQPAPALSAREAAQAVIAKAKPQAPLSLSDIPGGRVSAGTGEEAMAGMEGADLIAAMHDWPQEKIDRYMNSL